MGVLLMKILADFMDFIQFHQFPHMFESYLHISQKVEP